MVALSGATAPMRSAVIVLSGSSVGLKLGDGLACGFLVDD